MFLSPIFLWGLALVGIPILVHLIRKRKIKVIRWAAMEFLLQSQRKQRRKLRIEELILLALRVLIVALAAFAFARPVLRSLGIPLLSQNARVYAVIVLDNSFSMGHRGADSKTSFERAQNAAEEVVANILKPGDSVSVILLSDKPEDAVGDPSFDLKLVRQKIRDAKLSDRGTDYLEAAKRVNRRLKSSTAPAREVYFLTDDQASAWTTSKSDAAHNVWADMGKQSRVTWVSVGEKDTARENLAVGTPEPSRQLVTPKLPTTIKATIYNYGSKARSGLQVHLIVDGKTETQKVSIAPHGKSVVEFSNHRFDTLGTRTCAVELDDPQNVDGLTADNRAPFVVRVRDQLKVLVQDVHPAKDPAKSESFYMMTALAPGGEAQSMIPKLRDGEGFGGLDLREYDAVVVTGATGFSAPDVRVLSDYVKGGGGLLLFPGPYTDAQKLNTSLGEAGLLPAKLGTRRQLDDSSAVTLNPAEIKSPALLIFKNSTLNLGTARFTTYYPLEPVQTKDPNDVQTMLYFSKNDPAFVERKAELGRVILAASGAGTNWNELPVKASYLPLMYQLISYIGNGPTSSRNLKLNEGFYTNLPLSEAGKQIRITPPDGKSTTQASKLITGGVTFSYGNTGRAGTYKLEVTGGKTKDAFAVSLPVGESDLAYADPHTAAVESGLPASGLTIASSATQLKESVRQSRYGTEIWRPFIWAVLGLLFLESLLANLFGRRG